MLLTNHERQRLNELFRQLWTNRTGVKGSWASHRHGYHPTYIHRDTLLLRGELDWRGELWVLTPTAAVDPWEGDPRAHCSTWPVSGIEGRDYIKIHTHEDGPWWDLLRSEIGLMEDELAATRQASAADRQRAQQEAEKTRADELTLAAATVPHIRPAVLIADILPEAPGDFKYRRLRSPTEAEMAQLGWVPAASSN